MMKTRNGTNEGFNPDRTVLSLPFVKKATEKK